VKKTNGKREVILEAAFSVVAAKGYYETRVDDIARKAGVAKGTVYLHFKDKPDIYMGVVDWLMQKALDVVAEIDSRPISPRDKLSAVFSAWSEGVFSKPGVAALMSMEAASIPHKAIPRFRHVIAHRIRQLIEAVARVIRPGIESGQFRRLDPFVSSLAFLQAFRAGVFVAQRELGMKAQHQAPLDIYFSGVLARESTPGNRSKL